MVPNFNAGWCLMRTTRIKPMGYIGYTFTLYGKDDVTVLKEIKSKTASGMWLKIIKLSREDK